MTPFAVSLTWSSATSRSTSAGTRRGAQVDREPQHVAVCCTRGAGAEQRGHVGVGRGGRHPRAAAGAAGGVVLFVLVSALRRGRRQARPPRRARAALAAAAAARRPVAARLAETCSTFSSIATDAASPATRFARRALVEGLAHRGAVAKNICDVVLGVALRLHEAEQVLGPVTLSSAACFRDLLLLAAELLDAFDERPLARACRPPAPRVDGGRQRCPSFRRTGGAVPAGGGAAASSSLSSRLSNFE